MRKLLFFALVSITLAQEGRPDFSGTLCSRFADEEPVGVTTGFFTDNHLLCFRFEAKEAPAEGTRFTPGLAHADGTPIGRGKACLADGKTKVWRDALPIAGMEWAQPGGSFRWQLFRNDEEKPVLELPFSVTAAKRWALLVGINDYPGTDSDLTGCDVDIANMRTLLADYFFFPAEQVTVVRDLDATRARIEKELSDLADRAGPSDAVVFYYSGHGTQVPDLDGDEEDGWDEGICPAEPKAEIMTSEDDLKVYITDDRLAQLLDRFKTRNLTVIFDCCHSGSGLRAGDDVPTLPGSLTKARWQKCEVSRALAERAAEARARGEARGAAGADMGLDASERWVFITGCRSWEMSQGDAVDGGQMTSHLFSSLACSSGETWGQIMGRVRAGTTFANAGQSPTVEGAMRRYPFSLAEAEGEAGYVRPTFAVTGAIDAARSEPILRIPSGSAGKDEALVAGLSSISKEQMGVVCDVYPMLGPAAGAPHGQVEITGALLMTYVKDEAGRPAGEAPYSVAKILSGEVSEGDRLLPRAARVPLARPRVGLNFADEMRSAAVAIYNGLKAEPSVEVMDGWQFGDVDYILNLVREKDNLLLRIFNRGGVYLAVFKGSEAELAQKARDFVVARHTDFTRLMRLHNPSPAFPFTLAADGGEGPRKAGDSIVLRALAGEPAYVYVWAAAGETSSAFPLSASEGELAAKPMSITVNTPAGFKGRFFVKVFATKKPLDFMAIEGASDKPGEMLAQLQAAFPGGGTGLVSTDGWADEFAWFDLE